MQGHGMMPAPNGLGMGGMQGMQGQGSIDDQIARLQAIKKQQELKGALQPAPFNAGGIMGGAGGANGNGMGMPIQPPPAAAAAPKTN